MNRVKKIINSKTMIFSILVTMVFLVAACDATTDTKDVVPTGNIDVASIDVTADGGVPTISSLGGTLQMSATVLPANATNATYTWSVTNGTGSASISVAGLLTALTDGIITVRATSNLLPDVYGFTKITITNQIAANMDSTFSDLLVDGNQVLGFNPLVTSYVHVVSNGETATPTVDAVKYESTSTVDISDAIDITSTNVVERTTTITVLTTEGEEKVYYVIFEAQATPVDLGTAGDYVILAESGISTATTSNITGDIAVSPSPASYITGFSLTMDSSGEFSISSQVVGKVYSADYTVPTPTKLTTANEDMQLAYADAAGRASNYTELYSGNLSGKTLTPGVYKFSNSVLINTDLTLTGNATDVFIFQISGNLTMASNINIILAGGVEAKNVIWQVADTVAIGSGAHFEGTILSMTNISMGTNSSINGRLYAQTAVTLDATTVVKSKD